MNAIPRTLDDRSERSVRNGMQRTGPGLTCQKVNDCEDELLGASLEDIIAGVAAERMRADEALRALAGRLIEVQEEERKRLARELHDGLNQQLAMLTVELGMLAQQESASAIREQLSKLRDRSEGISNDMRHMAHRLHPAALVHLGLISALRSYCAEVSRNEGMRVEFRVASEIGPIREDMAACLYRITQEALRNVVKHSCSQDAVVEVDRDRHGIRLSIADKGVGFDVRAPKAGNCLGLVSLRERVQLLSGTLTIKSAPGEGTCVEVRVPLKMKKQFMLKEFVLKERTHGKTKTVAG